MVQEVSAKSQKTLKTYYYDKGFTYGRDGLFELLKKKQPKSHPSKEEIELWLKQQKIAQLYAQTRKGGVTDTFKPTKPWYQMSMDLIDFTNKPGRSGMRYILVVIDNFSRYMMTVTLTDKTAAKTAVGLRKVLDKVKSEFGNPDITSILTDDGGEFKGAVNTLLKQRDIRKIRTLGGNPQQNGMVERSNGKLKIIISKNRAIKGGGWVEELPHATEVYNQQYNRGIGLAPADAVKLDRTGQEKVKKHVKKAYHNIKTPRGMMRYEKSFDVGDRVRIKLNKGKLDKSSTPNWSSSIYSVSKVIPRRNTIAEKYSVKGKDADLKFSRNDLQAVDGDPAEVPKKIRVTTRKMAADNELSKGAFTRSKTKKVKAATTAAPTRRSTRVRK